MPALSFDQKVEGLQAYYRGLQEMDPVNKGHSEIANPAFFYHADGHHASRPLQKVMRGTAYDLECHGRKEYDDRGLQKKDLREDTDELRAERADVLSVMTAPLTAEDREQRAERIVTLLRGIDIGKPISLDEYDGSLRAGFRMPSVITVDSSRAIFGVFRNNHISSRILTLQYDSPVHYDPDDVGRTGETVVGIDVPMLVKAPRNAPSSN